MIIICLSCAVIILPALLKLSDSVEDNGILKKLVVMMSSVRNCQKIIIIDYCLGTCKDKRFIKDPEPNPQGKPRRVLCKPLLPHRLQDKDPATLEYNN